MICIKGYFRLVHVYRGRYPVIVHFQLGKISKKVRFVEKFWLRKADLDLLKLNEHSGLTSREFDTGLLKLIILKQI